MGSIADTVQLGGWALVSLSNSQKGPNVLPFSGLRKGRANMGRICSEKKPTTSGASCLGALKSCVQVDGMYCQLDWQEAPCTLSACGLCRVESGM